MSDDADRPEDAEPDAERAREGRDAHDRADAPSIDNPFADDATDGAAGPDAGSDPTDREDAPFGGLARTVAERRRDRAAEPEPFESVDVDDVDEDDLWASLATDDAGAPEPDPSAAEPVSSPDDDRPEHVVDKRAYCQQCPFLSAPPAVACEHEGTDIVEAVDADRFRVRGCPMVTADGSPDFGAAGDRAAAASTPGDDGDPAATAESEADTNGIGPDPDTTDPDA